MERNMSLQERTIQGHNEEEEASIALRSIELNDLLSIEENFWDDTDDEMDENNLETAIDVNNMETTLKVNNPEMDECDPDELQGTQISPKMKRRMVEHFGNGLGLLPRLANTKVTDRGAQALLNIDRDVRYKRRAHVKWFNLRLDYTNIGDVGLQALTRAFLKNAYHPLVMSHVKALDDETAVMLANALNTNPFYRELYIRQCNLGSSGLKALVGALSKNHVWQQLELGRTNLEDEGVDALAEALQQNTQWTNFRLENVQFSSVNGVKALGEALSVNKTWKSFQLAGSLFGKQVPVDDCEMEDLSCALRRNQYWKVFRYGVDRNYGGLVSIAKSLHGNSVWRVFDLVLFETKHVDIVAEGLRRQTSWKYFIWSLPYDTPDQGVEMLANLLKTSPSWERFVLHVGLDQVGPWLKVGPAILQRLEKHWNSLVLWFPYWNNNPIQHLPFLLENHPDEIGVTAETISNLFLTRHDKATDALEMAEYLGHCWQSMDLRMLPSNGALRVGRSFTIPRTISFHHTPRLTFPAALGLIQSIQGDGATSEIIDSNSASIPSAALASRPQGNVHWVCLSLSHLDIGDEGANAVADLFRNSHQWQIFDVADTLLNDTGIKALVEGMKSNPDWCCMNLSHTEISQLGARLLRNFLEGNTTWSWFSISHMPLSDEAFRRFFLSIDGRPWHTIHIGMNQANSPSSWKHPPNVPLLTAGAYETTSNETIQEGRLITKTKSHSLIGENAILMGRVIAGISKDVECLDMSLELAILLGLTLITNLDSMKSWNFDELGTHLLKVSDVVGRINGIRLKMSGAAALTNLSDHQKEKLQEILRFGIEVAKMMLGKLPSANQNPEYHIFISFAGQVRKERKFDYVTRLERELQNAAGGGKTLNIFVAEKTMKPGKQPDPEVTMLTHVLTAQVVVCVMTTHYVQKKWPIAELLCALARNKMACPHSILSPVVVDAFPGCQWVLPPCRSTASASTPAICTRDASEWINDFIGLFPTKLPSIHGCTIGGENVYGKCFRTSIPVEKILV